MTDKIDEIIARHDAATACGCSCCDTDYSDYAERKERDTVKADYSKTHELPESAASRRGSVRYIFETLLIKRNR